MIGKLKEEIGNKIGLKPGTVGNALTGLTSKKLLYSTSKGLYKLNPRYAFKGNTKERNAMLKAILEMECPDC